MIDEEIKDFVILAQKIIINYLEPLDKEKKDILDNVFANTSVMYANIDTYNGLAYCNAEKKILINNILKDNYELLLSYLIHEYAHMFMERNYILDNKKNPRWLGEGIADIFSDLVINKYFQYNTEKINGRTLNFDLPYVINSAYLFENSSVRTLLYPLEKEKKDKEAIQEILLGSPKKFIEMVTSKEISEQVEYTPHGIPWKFDLELKDIYLNKYDYYQDIDTKSIYYLKNAILPRFIINEKIKNTTEKKAHELHIYEAYNSNFIKNTYFRGLKIYEIPPEELKEFLDLYKRTRMEYGRLFQEDSYIDYVNNQIINLLYNQDEIINNCDKILDVMPYFVNDEIVLIGGSTYKVMSICLNEILNKIDKLEINDMYIQSVYSKLKDIVIPTYENLPNVEKSSLLYIMDLLNNTLKKIEDRMILIEDEMLTMESGKSKK